MSEATLAKVIDDVLNERTKQDEKWGEQNHDVSRWLMILGEEYGEACEAGCRVTFPNDPRCTKLATDNLKEELIQTAAVCVAIVECLERQALKREQPTARFTEDKGEL